jgi:hypothetical protein
VSTEPAAAHLDPAVAQAHQAVEAVEDLLVVGDGEDAGALVGGDLAQERHHHARALAVERRGLFVGQDDPRALGARAMAKRCASPPESFAGIGVAPADLVEVDSDTGRAILRALVIDRA